MSALPSAVPVLPRRAAVPPRRGTERPVPSRPPAFSRRCAAAAVCRRPRVALDPLLAVRARARAAAGSRGARSHRRRAAPRAIRRHRGCRSRRHPKARSARSWRAVPQPARWRRRRCLESRRDRWTVPGLVPARTPAPRAARPRPRRRRRFWRPRAAIAVFHGRAPPAVTKQQPSCHTRGHKYRPKTVDLHATKRRAFLSSGPAQPSRFLDTPIHRPIQSENRCFTAPPSSPFVTGMLPCSPVTAR